MEKLVSNCKIYKLVPGAGIEPAHPQGVRDFKSLASTYSATQAKERMESSNTSEKFADKGKQGGAGMRISC